jgi:tetratricopeptide (TPR) repeat protein
MIAIVEKDPAKQIEWNLAAIKMAEEKQQHAWLFALYNNIGESYLLLQQYAEAYEMFTKLAALQTARMGSADMYTVKDQAKAIRLLGDAAQSLELMQPFLDRLLAESKDDGYIRQEIAEALFALDKHHDAKPHFAKAYELLSQDHYVIQYEAANLERMKALSQ